MTVRPSGVGSEGRGLKYCTSAALGTTAVRIDGTSARARASSFSEQKVTPSKRRQRSISSRLIFGQLVALWIRRAIPDWLRACCRARSNSMLCSSRTSRGRCRPRGTLASNSCARKGSSTVTTSNARRERSESSTRRSRGRSYKRRSKLRLDTSERACSIRFCAPRQGRAGTSTTSRQYSRMARSAEPASSSGVMSETAVMSWRPPPAAISPWTRRCAPNVGGDGGNGER